MDRKQIVIVLNFIVRFIKNDKALYREGVHQIPISTISKFVMRSSLLPEPEQVIDWMIDEKLIMMYGYKDFKINKSVLRVICLRYNLSVTPANANVKAVKKAKQQIRKEITDSIKQHKRNVKDLQINLNKALAAQKKEVERLEKAELKGFARGVLLKKEILAAEENFIKSINESIT